MIIELFAARLKQKDYYRLIYSRRFANSVPEKEKQLILVQPAGKRVD